MVATALALIPLMIHNGLYVDIVNRSFAALLGVACALAVVQVLTRRAAGPWQRRLRDFSEFALAMIVLSVIGGVASYEIAADTSGFSDALLAGSDGYLHFDWLALYGMVVRHPLLQQIGAAAYGSIYLSPWLMLTWMAWHGHRPAAHRFLLTFWLAAMLTLALFPLLPARGALQFLWHRPIAYMPTAAFDQGTIIPVLRAHAIHAIDLGAVRGVVCAPSFHTVCAVVFMATAWPFAALRRIIVPLNLAMMLSTPVEGTHYLTDMLIGAIVAAVAILAVRTLTREPRPRAAEVRSPQLSLIESSALPGGCA